MDPRRGPGSHASVFFRVDDIDAAVAKVEVLGGSVDEIDVEGDDDSMTRIGGFKLCRGRSGVPVRAPSATHPDVATCSSDTDRPPHRERGSSVPEWPPSPSP